MTTKNTKRVLRPKWEVVDEDSAYTFQQKIGHKFMIMTVPQSEFKEKINVENVHVCGGCVDLPTKGYDSEKYGWCSFSREIANLYPRYQFKLEQRHPPLCVDDLELVDIADEEICINIHDMGRKHKWLMAERFINDKELYVETKKSINNSLDKHFDILDAALELINLWFPFVNTTAVDMFGDIDKKVMYILDVTGYPRNMRNIENYDGSEDSIDDYDSDGEGERNAERTDDSDDDSDDYREFSDSDDE